MEDTKANISEDAEEILKICKGSTVLPLQMGPKDQHKDALDSDSARTTQFYNELSDVLKEERVYRKSAVITAEWSEEKQIVIVNKIKGSCWSQFGFAITGGINVLHPEEALFLIEQSNLELHLDEVPLSLQEAYSLLLPRLPSLEYYKVYAYLNRAGYKVQRWKQHLSQDSKSMQPCPDSTKTSSTPNNIQSIVIAPPISDDALGQLRCGPGVVLWDAEIGSRPLVNPADATSCDAVMATMRAIPTDLPVATASRHTLDFCVYDCPVKRYKKSCPGIPLFNVAVCRFDEQPPSPSELASLLSQSCDVPFKCAIAGHDAVTLLSVFYPALPVLSSTT